MGIKTKVHLEIEIAGVVTPPAVTPDYPNVLYVPIERESDIQIRYIEAVSEKIGNDPNVDVYTNLPTVPILLNLRGGAWQEFFDINSRKYFEPYHNRPTASDHTTIVQPLLWTLDKEYPVLPGCELVTAEGSTKTLDQYVRFRDKLYALDLTNNKVWKLPSTDSAWVDVTPSGSGTLFSLYSSLKNGTLYLGSTSGLAWGATSNDIVSGSWTAIGANSVGSLYVNYGNEIYYVANAVNYTVTNKVLTSNVATLTVGAHTHPVGQYVVVALNPPDAVFDGLQLISAVTSTTISYAKVNTNIASTASGGTVTGDMYSLLKRNAAAATKQKPQFIGDRYKEILALAWADRFIAAFKADGFYIVDPHRQQGGQTPLMPFPFLSDNNTRVMFTHGREVYFAMNDLFFSWNMDTNAIVPKEIARSVGHKKAPFLYGRVLAGMSDQQRIYLVYKVARADSSGNAITDHYLLIGDGEDWHPVLVVSTWGTGENHAAVWFDNQRLRFSMGGKSGYLRTDGRSPQANSAFTWSTNSNPAGITTGWIDLGRDWLIKWWKELRVSQLDPYGTEGTSRFFYQLWGEANDTWTQIGDIDGTADNEAVEFPEGADLADISGVVKSKLRLRVDLRKSGSSDDDKAHYLSSVHVVAMPFNQPVIQVTFNAYFDVDGVENSQNNRSYDSQEIYNALIQAQMQAQPIRLTLPSGEQFFGTLVAGGVGRQILSVNTDNGEPNRYKYALTFTQHR